MRYSWFVCCTTCTASSDRCVDGSTLGPRFICVIQHTFVLLIGRRGRQHLEDLQRRSQSMRSGQVRIRKCQHRLEGLQTPCPVTVSLTIPLDGHRFIHYPVALSPSHSLSPCTTTHCCVMTACPKQIDRGAF